MEITGKFLIAILIIALILSSLDGFYYHKKAIQYSNQINEIGKITDEIYNRLHSTDTLVVEKLYPADSIDNMGVFHIVGEYDSTKIKGLIYDFKRHGIYDKLDYMVIYPSRIQGWGRFLPDSSFVFLGNSIEEFLNTETK